MPSAARTARSHRPRDDTLPLLARTKSTELGLRTKPAKGWTTSLALWQANTVAARLAAAGAPPTRLVIIKTSGDQLQDRPLSEVGGKRLFVKEIDWQRLIHAWCYGIRRFYSKEDIVSPESSN